MARFCSTFIMYICMSLLLAKFKNCTQLLIISIKSVYKYITSYRTRILILLTGVCIYIYMFISVIYVDFYVYILCILHWPRECHFVYVTLSAQLLTFGLLFLNKKYTHFMDYYHYMQVLTMSTLEVIFMPFDNFSSSFLVDCNLGA